MRKSMKSRAQQGKSVREAKFGRKATAPGGSRYGRIVRSLARRGRNAIRYRMQSLKGYGVHLWDTAPDMYERHANARRDANEILKAIEEFNERNPVEEDFDADRYRPQGSRDALIEILKRQADAHHTGSKFGRSTTGRQKRLP